MCRFLSREGFVLLTHSCAAAVRAPGTSPVHPFTHALMKSVLGPGNLLAGPPVINEVVTLSGIFIGDP